MPSQTPRPKHKGRLVGVRVVGLDPRAGALYSSRTALVLTRQWILWTLLAVAACSSLNRPRYECEPAAEAPAGCALGEGCHVEGEPQTSTCGTAGDYFDNDPCATNDDCGSGFNCVSASQGGLCRKLCILGGNTDCSSSANIRRPYACVPPAPRSTIDRYGFCCPTTGC
jgi:hypothetical protein